ncbi:MAG: carbon-nitrogen hydrolase family protein [Lentisphaerae bacterium]|jgi:predicted amidohydrolase|nr:carbon-nitrogen hydrolase family protein [Lentisphaerota bacterium]MBT4817800.1 carbon-nitrogen hydrolase family protein [Lentisphaerota bacterium]MBT5612127.1 carbon-nitrogen hydrolase family protein [Lentisphaerota bacterium]MBT7058774.1 carbon-nitrogen hydrolase family protein [Lentisphaerota bacterium]
MTTADDRTALIATPWAPRAEIAPQSRELQPGVYETCSNGSTGCYGGWDITFTPPESPWVRVLVTADIEDLDRGLDCLRGALFWGQDTYTGMIWEPVLVEEKNADGSFRLGTHMPIPSGGRTPTLRLLLCDSAAGRIVWRDITVEPAEAPPKRPWRLAAGAGPLGGGERTVATNTEAYLGFCREAAEKNVDLLCLPEVMLTTGIPCDAEHLVEQAIAIPGKETQPFQEFCRDNGMVLCFSAWERTDDLVTNTAFLIDRSGDIAGKYRKVHLASPVEPWWGVTAGNEFPVADVHGAQIAMNICMDSSVAESARVPAMQGAEIVCMPIMGDHRSVTGWTGGPSDFDIDRWRAIQKVRAMDNQVYMVISVNAGIGTCIVSPCGEVLDMLQGRRRIAFADVELSDWPRTTLHSTFRNVNRWVRRQPTYTPLLDMA